MRLLDIVTAGPWNVFFLLALLTGFVLASREARRIPLPTPEWLALLSLAVAAGVLGARGLHFDAAAPGGAKTILGAVALGAAVLFAGTRLLRLDARAPDALVLALPLGFAVGRIGCLLAGCCFGHVTDVPWGTVYDAQSPAFAMQLRAGLIEADAAAALPVHPTQLYEAMLGLLAAAAVPRLRRSLRAPGSLLLAVLVVMATGRLLLEFFRARDAAVIGGMSSVQWLIAAAVAVMVLALLSRERAVSTMQRPTPRPVVVLVAIASVPPLLLLGSGAHLSHLDRLAVTLFAFPPLVACALQLVRDAAWTRSTLAMPAAIPCALLVLALQQAPQQSSAIDDDRVYPRSEMRFGIGYARTEQREERVVGRVPYEDSCTGSSGWTDVFEGFDVARNLGGASIAYSRHSAPARSSTVRLLGFAGSESAVPDGINSSAEWNTTLGGVGSSISFDRPVWGVTFGVAGGRFSGDSAQGNVLGIGGLRIGRVEHLHLFAGVNDAEPLGQADAIRAGMAYGTSRGAVVRAGVSGEGTPFIGGTLPLSHFHLESSAVLGREYDVRVGLSYTTQLRR